MEARKPNRNALRSKQMIRAAYMQLLEEKPYEKITATDIIGRAQINRSTFYAHYPDVRGIMDEIMLEITGMFREMLQNVDFTVFFQDPMPILSQVIVFLERNQPMYRLILRSPMALEQLEQLKKLLIAQVLEIPGLPVGEMGCLAVNIRVRMLLSGLIDTYRQWLEGEFDCTLEEAAREVGDFIKQVGMEIV